MNPNLNILIYTLIAIIKKRCLICGGLLNVGGVRFNQTIINVHGQEVCLYKVYIIFLVVLNTYKSR